MKYAKHSVFCVALLLLFPTGLVGNDKWFEKVDDALAAARSDGKDLFLLYTGSDWCPSCIKLEEEILSKQEFLSEAGQDFVMMVFDFPRKKELAPETIKQNKVWAEKYGVEGYPTVILIDQEQRPYGITGYRDSGVEGYLGILGEFHNKRIRRDEAFEKAKALKGIERAKMLDQALSEIEPELAELYYEEIVKEIVDIDKEDSAGLRTKWNASKDSEMRKIIMTDIVMISRLEKPDVAIKFIDDVFSQIKFSAEQRLQIMQIKLNLLRTTNKVEALDAMLDEMIAIEELTEESRQRMIVKKILLMVGTGRRNEGLQLLEESIREAGQSAAHLWLAKGQLLDHVGKFEDAIKAYESGINSDDPNPDLLIDLYGAKADSYMALDNELRAIQTLDKFAEDEMMPSDLRAEALLQKSMIMRDSGRNRLATLVENSAIELAGSPQEQAEMRKLVERLRKKYGG